MSAPRPPSIVRAVLIGVTGRMGGALLKAAPAFPQLLFVGAIASAGSLALGRDAGEVAGVGRLNLTVESNLLSALSHADVALDFSSPTATRENLRACREARKALLLGTTGYGGELEALLETAARDIPLLVAPNTSVGVAVLTELVRAAARGLPADFDIDVLDFHHRGKADAPSGTALALASAAAAARGTRLRPGTGSGRPGIRPEGEVEMASVRAGDLVGEHTVLFSGIGEQLSLTHRAADRAIFARGAIEAAVWLAARPPGRYTMTEVLGFKTEG